MIIRSGIDSEEARGQTPIAARDACLLRVGADLMFSLRALEKCR
jgi:hypothetical protein